MDTTFDIKSHDFTVSFTMFWEWERHKKKQKWDKFLNSAVLPHCPAEFFIVHLPVSLDSGPEAGHLTAVHNAELSLVLNLPPEVRGSPFCVIHLFSFNKSTLLFPSLFALPYNTRIVSWNFQEISDELPELPILP